MKDYQSRFNHLSQLYIQKYSRYLPTAFDESLTLLEKVNMLIETINNVVKRANDLTDFLEESLHVQWELINQLKDDWEDMKEWLLNEGLEQAVSEKLTKWYNDGKLADIINNTVFNMKVDKKDMNTRQINALYPPDNLEPIVKGGIVDNTERLQLISDYANEHNVPLFIPNGLYRVDGKVHLYTDTTFKGEIISKGLSDYVFAIYSRKPMIDLPIGFVNGLTEGSTLLNGLDLKKGDTIIIRSDERLIKRNNPVNTQYTKTDSFMCLGGGHVFPPVDRTYDDLTLVRSFYYRERESALEVKGLALTFDSDTHGGGVLLNRSNSIIRDYTVSALNNTTTMLLINDCVNVTVDNVQMSNCYYGVSVSNASLVKINNSYFKDCGRSVTGRHGKHVTVEGGFHNVIDSHWGNYFVVKNLDMKGLLQYAGTDFMAENVNIMVDGSAMFQFRHDTPELDGTLSFKNVNVKYTPSNLRFLIYMNIVSKSVYDWEKTLRLPKNIFFENINVSGGQDEGGTSIIRFGSDGLGQDHSFIGNLTLKNINSQNRRLSIINEVVNQYTMGDRMTSKVIVKGVDHINFSLTSGVIDVGYGFDFLIEDVKGYNGLYFQVHPQLIANCVIKNCKIERYHYHISDLPYNGETTFQNCEFYGTLRSLNYFYLYDSILNMTNFNQAHLLQWCKIARGNAIPVDSELVYMDNYTNTTFYKTSSQELTPDDML